MDRFPDTSTTMARPGLLPAATLSFLCCAVFAWLLLRNHGLPPAIFADEWYYSKMSRLQPLSEAIVPSYLYLWLFRATNACGDGFLDCVRIGNELFFAASAPFIYAVARKVASRPLSLLIATVALLAPINIYTSFFMPEAAYYFGFAVLSWVVLAWRGRDTLRNAAAHGAAAGTVLGLMSLIKVHALFLLPALCLYLAAACRLGGGARRLARGGLAALLAAALTLAFKFGLGWLLAGEEALSVFGSFYSGTANAHARRPLSELLQAAWTSGSGHLMAMAVLQALPLALLIQGLASRSMRTQASRALLRLQLYALLMLGAAAGMTVMFTASIADAAPTEVLRLHLRYYSFVFPLLLMLAAATIGAPWPAAPRALAWPLALLLAAALVCAAWKLPGYAVNAVDGPEIHAVGIDSLPGRIVVGIELLVLLLWACGSRYAAPLFLFVAVPWMTAQGVLSTAAYLRNIDPRSPADVAGKFAHAYVPAAERNQVTVAGTDVIQVMRAQFHIDAPDTGTIGSPQDAPLQPYDMPLRNKWLLVIGHHPLPPGVQPEVATAGYTLARMDTRRRVIGITRFKQPLAGGLVEAAEGLSHLESWGRWSDTRRIVLHFSRPLPERANVVIKAQAYGPNAGLPFTMRIGGEEQHFRIQELPQDVSLRFTTDGRQRRLEIDIPKPTVPRDVSPSIDTRPLGLGLSEIEISTPDA